MTQDKKYIDRVYSALSDKVEGFNKTPEEFYEAIKNDDYKSRVYSALSDKVEGFNKTPEEFNSLLTTDPQKKNSNYTGSQTQKDSQSKATPKPSTSVGGKPIQTGGSASSAGGGKDIYTTKLTPNEEAEFNKWYSNVSRYKKIGSNPDDEKQLYDYRGFWKNEKQLRKQILTDNEEAHFIDKYKKPGHPTFSDQSIYSNEKTKGGTWSKDKNGRFVFNHSDYTKKYAEKTLEYLTGSGEFSAINGKIITNNNDLISSAGGGKKVGGKEVKKESNSEDLISKFGIKPGEKIQGVEKKAYEAQRNQPKVGTTKSKPVVSTKPVSETLTKQVEEKYETLSKIPAVTEKIEKGTKLTPDELITISQQQDLVINQSYNPEISKEKLNDELNEYQFLDGISEGMRKTTNKFFLQPITDINSYFGGNKDFTIKKGVPLAKEKEEAEINLINKGITDYSKEDIFEEAKKIFLKNDELSQKKNATDSYFSSLTDGHQVQRELEIKLKADYFSKDQEIKKNIQLFQVNEDRIDAYNKFLIEIDNKGFATDEDKEKGKYLFDLATKASEENKIMRKSLKDDQAKLDNDKDKLELLKYNYNDLDKTRYILNNFFKETIGGALKLIGETRELAYEQTIGRLTDAEYVDPLTSAGDYIMNIGAEYNAKQPEFRMMTLDDVNNFEDFGSYFAQVSTEQAGVASAFAVAGPLGLELVSAGSGGSKIKQLEDQGKQPFGKQYTKAQKVLIGWAYYGAEKYSEKFSTFKYLEDMKMSLKNISSASRELSQKSFKKELGKMFGTTAAQTQVGGLSESSASLANSLSDIYLLGEELSSDDIAKAMKESYTAGILMDGGTASFGALSTFASKQLRAITDNKDINKVRSILDKVNEINTEIKSNLLLTESDKTNLDNKANELINEAVGIVTKSVDNIEKLSVEDISKLLDINKEQSELKSKFDELKKSAMSSDLKKEEYTDLNNRFKELESRRNDILAGTFKEFNYLPEEESTKLKIQAAEELKEEAIKSGIEEDKVNIKEEDITKRAIENYEKQPKETTAEKPIEEGPTGQEGDKGVVTTQGQEGGVVQEEKITKTEQDAIQEQSTGKGVLRPEQSEMGLQEVVEGDQESKVTTEEGKEKITPGAKSNVSGVEITYPTEDEAKARRDERSKPQYVQSAVETLEEEDTDTLKKELEGEFGLLTAENPMAQPLTEEENDSLNKKAMDWLKSRGYKPRRVVGKYGQAENSFFVPNLSKADAVAFAKEFNQESVAHSEGLVYQDGSVNPRNKNNDKFELSEDYNEDSDFVSVVNTKDGPKTFSVGYNFGRKVGGSTDTVTMSTSDTNFDESIKESSNKRIAKIAANAAKSLSKILPNLKIVLHNTNESFISVSGESKNQSSSGLYQNGTIHINLEKANRRTVAHEVFHAILLDKVKTDSNAASVTKKMIEALAPMLDKNKALKQRLQDFADNYDENIQNEEKIAELVGILASNFDSLSGRAKEAIKNWLNSLAKMFGVEAFESNEVLDVLNTIAKSVATGKEISGKEISIISEEKTSISDLTNRFQANFKDPVSGVEFVYDKNTDKFNKLEKDGFITKNKSITDFDGKILFLHQPDAAFSGMIYKNGELLVEGKGGMYYPIKFHEDGYFWASTSTTAKKMAEDLNKVYKENGGQILMALTTAPSDKLLSSTTAANGVMELILSKAFDRSFSINKDQIKKSLVEAAKKTIIKKTLIKDKKTGEPILDKKGNKQYKEKTVGINIKLKKGDSLESIKSEIANKLNPENSSFDDRKTFVESLLSEIANIVNLNPKAVDQFGKFFSEGIKNKYFKGITKTGKLSISAANLKQAFSEMLTEPMLKEGVERNKGGQVYAIIELNGEVKPIDSNKHESYPKAIQSKNPKENKVKLHILKDRVRWNDVFEDPITNEIVSKERELKIFPTSGVSTTGLKLNTKNIKRQQKALPENVSKKLTETPDGKVVFKHFSDERRDVIKRGQGQNRITSTEESSALSAVGGLAMFYTMANQTESGVGNVEHTILVDKNKVYDIDSDPMGFEAEARKRFNETRPGQAFTNNYRGAFITQIANENGFDIAVSQWRGGELRAQTTLELKPEASNTQFKERPLPTFSVGEVAMIDGKESVIEAIDGNRIKYRSLDGTSQGVTVNNERNRRSLLKIEPTPAARQQRAFDKKRKAAINNVKGGKYGSLTNTSKSNKETIVEHETMKVKILNLAMLFPKIVEKAVDADLFEKYKNAIMAMSERRLAVQTVMTAKEVADLYDQIIDDYTNFSEIQNAVLNGEVESLPKEQKDFYYENEGLFNKAKPAVEVDEDALAEKRDELKDEVMSYVPSIKEAPKQYDTKSMSFKIAELLSDISLSDLELLTNAQLENLRRVLETISLGEDIPTYANDIYQEILSNRNMVLSSNIAEKYNRTGFNKIPLRRVVTKITDGIREFFNRRSNLESRASRYPLVFADTANKIFGVLPKYADFIKGKYGGIPIYTHIFSSIEKSEGALQSRKEEVSEVFEKVNNILSKKSKNIDESYRKIHFAFLQIQAWANPGNKKVKDGVTSFSENFNNSDSPYSDKQKKAYREFVNKYKGYQFIKNENGIMVFDENGNDVTNQYFTKEELDSYNAIRKELDNQKVRAEETSMFNNNNALPFVNEYFPENNFSKKASAKSINEDPLAQNFSNNATVKSKNLLEKTAVAHPVMHNPFAVALISINGTEMQYQLLNPIQIARKTMKKIIEDNNLSIRNSEGADLDRYNELAKVYANIESSIETLVEHLKGANIGKPDALDNVSDILTNTFYVGALASGIRTAADLSLNYQHLITSEPTALKKGFEERNKIKDVVKSDKSKDADSIYRAILKYIDASQINRVMGVVNLTSVRSEFQSEGANPDITRKGVESDASKTFKKVTGVVSPISSAFKTINESLMSVSDNMPALNFFIGSFAKEFKEATGLDFDWNAAANNDAEYMLANSDAINYASTISNYKLATYLGSKNVSSKSPAVVSAMRGQDGKAIAKLVNRANYLFKQFTMASTAQFLSSLNNLFEVENMRDVSKQSRIMIGSSLRTSLYSAVSASIVGAIWGFFRGDDEDEDIIRENSDDLSNDSNFIKKLYTIKDNAKKYKESLEGLDPELEIDVQKVMEEGGEFKKQLLSLFEDKRFRDLFDANYRFYAREMFTMKINGLASDTGMMRKYSKETVDSIVSRIDSGDKSISQSQLEFNLAYLNSEIGRSLINQEEREDYIEKIEKYLADTNYYLLYKYIGSYDEFDPTTPEGAFKSAAFSVTIDNLLKHRDNSFFSNLEKGTVETGVNLFTGVRGSFPQKGVSYLIELINKKHKEETRGYYDFEKDRYNYATPDIMLSDKKFDIAKTLESLTPPELAVIIKGFQRNRETDAALIALRIPGISDLNRIGGAIKRDDVYQNARGKFIDNEIKKFLERKLIITEEEKKKKAEEEAKYNSKLVQDKNKIRRVTK